MAAQCSVAGCNRVSRLKGYCNVHYQRARKGRPLEAPVQLRRVRAEFCSVAGCQRPCVAKDLCSAHYARLREKGVLLSAVPVRRRGQHKVCQEGNCQASPKAYGYCPKHYKYRRTRGTLPEHRFVGKVCSVSGCQRPHYGNGLCDAHYARSKQGSVRAEDPIKVFDGSGYLNAGGYRVIYRPKHSANKSGSALEHRVVAAEFLGRPLTKAEYVHHRNGNRHENSIGSCLLQSRCDCTTYHNLELWSKSQPPGQRVADKIQWAAELLQLYGRPLCAV